ncbi:celp effector like [Pyrenophora seminiperda CCB06]|uniref:Celp effector like n=1 Tax=Pyrenophora seminiperda CCB06 TaxID=1302712 RepID=A0A3M7MCW9_9PLEO|nr:celp effector like [Pyrenophora seminiperda CCB06]
MHFTPSLLLAASIASVAAAPAPIQIGVDDVILHGNGHFMLMKREDFAELEAARNSDKMPPAPAGHDDKLITYTGKDNKPTFNGNETDDSPRQPLSLHKRGTNTIILPKPNTRFLGWDVQMSAVVKGAPTTISVSQGFTIGNSITVGVSSMLTIVKDYLSVTMSTDYSRSWSSIQTQTFMAPVPAGKYGAFVSNAWTTRASGNVWTGTVGGGGDIVPYQADSFSPKQYGDMSWVDGVISLCIKDTFPMPRCLGAGTL